MVRDVNIGIPEGDGKAINVADATVVKALDTLTQAADALREEARRTRKTSELILGQEVETEEDD